MSLALSAVMVFLYQDMINFSSKMSTQYRTTEQLESPMSSESVNRYRLYSMLSQILWVKDVPNLFKITSIYLPNPSRMTINFLSGLSAENAFIQSCLGLIHPSVPFHNNTVSAPHKTQSSQNHFRTNHRNFAYNGCESHIAIAVPLP